MALHHSISFDPADPLSSLRALPEAAGVFALYAADPSAEPYLSKTSNLRRRLTRFLRAGRPGTEPGQDVSAPTKRLQLAHMVHRIEYSVTGSELESTFCLYQASMRAFGDGARRRLRLRPPAFLRMSLTNPYPRVYPTTKIVQSAANALFGPFPSRAAAERYAEEMLNLFLLRRCHEELHPDPAFPGCPYSEMKMCLAPCYKGCSDERYQEESGAVRAFLETSGGSLLAQLETERNAASEALEFENAAHLHQRMQKVQAVARLAGETVRPLAHLSGILIQPAAEREQVKLFALNRGFLSGPACYSTQGMRLPNERSGSSSLFAHPIAVEAVPLENSTAARPANQKDLLESRLDAALAELGQTPIQSSPSSAPNKSMQIKPAQISPAQILPDHLALLARWLYSPAARRVGEMVFAESDGQVPRKPLLRAIARVAARAASLDTNADPSQIPTGAPDQDESLPVR